MTTQTDTTPKPERATPKNYQRQRALELAVDTVKAGTFNRPGTSALVIAAEYAQFLADGTMPGDAQ